MLTLRAVPIAVVHTPTGHESHGHAWQVLAGAVMMAVMSTEACADDSVLGRFTSSLSKMYQASQMCEGTLTYSPANYVEIVQSYMSEYYPDGAGYWVLPAANEHITNIDSCIAMLEQRLFDYKSASIDFHEDYPQAPLPPSLRIVVTEEEYRGLQTNGSLQANARAAAGAKRVVYDGVGP